MKRLALILLACVCAAVSAQAQSYPVRPITITVTAAPGGVTDVVGRAIGQRLSESWGQQVVIENKGGAAHVLGAASVAKAAPDGYSLLLAEAGAFVINPTLYGKGKLPYDEDALALRLLDRFRRRAASERERRGERQQQAS